MVNDDSSGNLINVLANDTIAPDAGEILTIIAVTQSAHGTVVNNGTNVSYTPAPNYFGPDSFTYTISDGNGGSDTATVSVTVVNVNDNPDAVNDAATVNEDSSGNVINVLANDTIAPDAGETLTLTAVTQAAHGTVVNNGTNVSYTPTPNYIGPDSFTYTISDGNGGSDSATVNVTVVNVNDNPDAVNDTATVNEDSSGNVLNVLANDTISPDSGETLTITAVTQAAHGAVVNNGTNVSYTPALNYFGPDSFTYTISDGNGGSDSATVTVTVVNVNDNPDAVNDTATVTEDSSGNVINVLANDTIAPDAGETLTIIAVTQAAHGTVVNNVTNVSYTPGPNYFGPDSFTYTISDGKGGSDTATVSVNVVNTNDNPDAVNDTANVNQDSSGNVISVLANDTIAPDAGETLTITAVTQPAHGTVVNIGTNVSYTASPNYFGPDSFTYTISDGNGGSDSATVNVSVNASQTNAQADLAITKLLTSGPAVPGLPASYTITVTNRGPSPVSSVTLNDPAPSIFLNPVFTPRVGTTYNPTTKVWTFATPFAVGQSYSLILSGAIDPAARAKGFTTITNTASVAAPAGVTDVIPGNNIATRTDLLMPKADLHVRKIANVATVLPGGQIVYRIIVTNLGPSTVSQLALNMVAPYLATQTYIPNTGTYNSVTKVWSGLSLARGTSIVLTVVGQVSTRAIGAVDSVVGVSPLGGIVDPDLTNNQSKLSILVPASKRSFLTSYRR
jgi:uncharacterized repeat protein (TIGR01451 family)